MGSFLKKEDNFEWEGAKNLLFRTVEELRGSTKAQHK